MENSELTIKEGYKQTDVGIIPEDWEVKKLYETADIVRGGSPRPAGDPKYFNGNFIPWLTVAALTNVPESQNYISETVGFLTEEGSKHSRTLEKGTLIIANSGATLGVTKILSVKCCANDGIAAFLNVEKSVDKLFLCHYLNTQTKFFREVIATGNGQPNLNTDLIGNVSVPLPPLPEQQAIAEVLSDVDALVTSLDQLITKKRNIKQGAMQLLLTGKKRLAGFSGDWETKTIKELNFDISDGNYSSKYPNQEDFIEFGVPFIRANNIKKMNVADEEMRFISAELHAQLQKGHLKKNDILITTRGEIGQVAIVPDKHIASNINAQIVRINTGKNFNHIYFAYYLLQEDVQQTLQSYETGSALKQLPVGKLVKLPVKISLLSEQKAIAQILSEMDAEIEALETRQAKYKAVKQGMMQELLTGKTWLI